MEFIQKLSQQIRDNPEDHNKADEAIVEKNSTDPHGKEHSVRFVVLGKEYASEGSSKELVMPKSDGNKATEGTNNNNSLEKCVGGSNFLSNLFSPIQQEVTPQSSPFLLDVYSRLNFTYRTRFIPIERATDGPSPLNFNILLRESPLDIIENAIMNPDCFNTDIGWGCMIRTGQSLLGNALQRILYGRNFAINNCNNDNDDGNNAGNTTEDSTVTNWFQDIPEMPFSLHRFVEKGISLSNMKPGQWFGPAATSRSIQSLVREFPQCGIDNCIVSISSGDIFKQDIDSIYDNVSGKSNTLILLGVKLGLNTVTKCYWQDILHLLSSKFSVGIAGGRPSSSLYFFGYERLYLSSASNQEYFAQNNDINKLLYFDPHKPQLSLNGLNDYKTCHSIHYGKLDIKDMDPSMLIGILLQDKNDWEQFQVFAKDCEIINIFDSTQQANMDIDLDFEVESLNSEEGDVEPNGPGDLANRYSPRCEEDIEREYVDLGKNFHHNGDGLQADYQNIQCKRQKIMVLSHDDSIERIQDNGVEIERVLVENETLEPAKVG